MAPGTPDLLGHPNSLGYPMWLGVAPILGYPVVGVAPHQGQLQGAPTRGGLTFQGSPAGYCTHTAPCAPHIAQSTPTSPPICGTHVDDGLLGLRHVRDDAVGDDEQHKVLGPIQHRRRRAGGHPMSDTGGVHRHPPHPPRGAGTPPPLPGDVVNDGGEVGGSVELDAAQAAVIRLQDALDAATRRVGRVTVLQDEKPR